MEDNLFSIRKKNFNLNESILNTIKIFEEILRKSENKINFVFTDHRDSYFIMGDKTRIEQVISNLIHNSIKSITRAGYDNEDGRISIIIKNKNKKEIHHKLPRFAKIVDITIDDNGRGIDPKLMPSLFTKFTKSVDGNGLGLYISKKIIESHGGKITVENRKRIGARFNVSLPLNSIRNAT